MLPFENLGDASDEYFADGITDEVRGKLATLPGLQVIAGSSAGQYKHSTKPPQQIAQELGVQYLLIGKIRWEKGAGGQSRVRVSPELVQVAGGAPPTTKWQQPFDASLTDVFQVQADIAGRVARALDVALGAQVQQQLAEKPTQNLAAYDAYLKGVEAYQHGRPLRLTLRQALGYFEQAVALDTTFAIAWARLSQAGLAPERRRRPVARRRRPVPPGGRAGAGARARPAGRPRGAGRLLPPERPGQRARARGVRARPAPGAVATRSCSAALAWPSRRLGRWDASLAHLQQALTLDPRSATTARVLATALVFMRRYREAREAADRALAIAPGGMQDLRMEGDVVSGRGRPAGARGSSSETPPSRSSPPRWWPISPRTTTSSGCSTPSSRSCCCAWGPTSSTTTAARGGWRWPAPTRCAGTRRGPAPSPIRRGSRSRSRFAPRPRTPGCTRTWGPRWPISAGRRTRSRSPSGRSRCCRSSKDAINGPYMQHQLARTYILVGEPEKALDQLEPLLKIPYYLSPAWLRIDPTFDPLRANPRFQRLVAATP